jgi:hypothetical protein
MRRRQAYMDAVMKQLESVAQAHREKKAGPLAMDPMLLSKDTPTQKAKGKSRNKKRNKIVQLLKLSALVVMSHPFGVKLASWDNGVAVDCGAEWTRRAIYLAVGRGPHPTVQATGAVAMVHDDLEYQVKAGLMEVVYWDDIEDRLPANFKVSPVAVIPQTGRRGRIILDLSFPVRRPPNQQDAKRRKMGEVVGPSVNDTTKKLAPQGPVQEIGKVLPRMFHFMVTTPEDQEIRLSKVDLLNGFWRLVVKPEQQWNFCYVMPDPPGSRVRIVVPSVLQMEAQHTSVLQRKQGET